MNIEINKLNIHELTVNKSKFICYLKNIYSTDEFDDFFNEIKILHPSARHLCCSYIIGDVQPLKKASDGGEPKGTAGMPMLNILEKNNIVNVGAIVVRYFGGIKLGAGGLIRSYSNAVKECLTLSNHYRPILRNIYELSFSFQYSGLENVIRNSHNVRNVTFLDKIYMYIVTEDIKRIEELSSTFTKGNYQLNHHEIFKDLIKIEND